MNINARYLKWVMVMLPIACMTYAAPLTLNKKIEFLPGLPENGGEYANLNQGITQDLTGPGSFFYCWTYTGTLGDKSKIQNSTDTATGADEDKSGWGLYLDTNQGQLSILTRENTDEQGILLAAPFSDNPSETDGPIERWISMDVVFAASDTDPDIAAMQSTDTVDGPRMVIFAVANDDGSATIKFSGYDGNQPFFSAGTSVPSAIATTYTIAAEDLSKTFTLQIATKGYTDPEGNYFLNGPAILYKLSIIEPGSTTPQVITTGRGFNPPATFIEMIDKENYTIDTDVLNYGQGEWVSGINTPLYGDDGSGYTGRVGVDAEFCLNRIQFEGTGFIDNLQVLDEEPVIGGGVEMPEGWADGGVLQASFDAWVDKYGITSVEAADLDAYLFNQDQGVVPTLEITSIVVEDGQVTVTISALANGTDPINLDAENADGINGVLSLQIAEDLTAGFDDPKDYNFTMNGDSAVVVVNSAFGAKFVKATVVPSAPKAIAPDGGGE